ncbi:706_t:CDS:2, partial [Gigaspora rosea]
TSALLRRSELDLTTHIDLVNKLNRSENILEQAIKQAADENIPKTKVSPKTFYAFSRKATKLHSALQKEINAINMLGSTQILEPPADLETHSALQ